jgi:hypothetical protein
MPVTTATARPATRRVLVMLLALVGLGAAMLLLVAVRIAIGPNGGAPFDDGPIVVLGGGGSERLDVGLALRGDSERPLVVSADAVERYAAQGGTCQIADAICLDPVPESTFGEALAVAAAVERFGWPQVTVVTSDFHTFRTRLLFDRCVPVPVTVVGAPTDPALGEHLYRIARESVATLVAVTRRCG